MAQLDGPPVGAVPDGDALSIFSEVLQSVSHEAPAAETLDLICRRICELAGFVFCGVLLPDSEWRRVHLAGSHGFPAALVERLDELFLVPIGDQAAGSPTRAAVEQRRTVVLRDALEDESFKPWRSLAVEFGYRSLLSVPLIVEGQVIGVLNGYSEQRRDYSAPQLAAVETLAAHAALSLRLTMLVDARQETIIRLRESNEELERQRTVLERAHEIHRRLTAAVLVGTDFQGIATALSELIDRVVVVTDARGNVVSTSSDPPEHEVRERLDAAVSRLGEGLDPVDTIVAPIRIGAEKLGSVIVLEGDAASRALDLRAVEHAATVLALEIVKERVARTTEERLHADFVSDLIRGHQGDVEHIAEHAHQYGLTLGLEHRVITIVIDEASRGPALDRTEISRLVAAELTARIPGTLVSGTADTVTAVAPVDAIEDPVTSLRAVIATVQRQLDSTGADVRLSAGIGGAARDPVDFAASHHDAELCVDLLRRVDRQGETIARDELGVLGLFVDNKRPDELVSLARRTLGPAIDRDAERNGDLIQTLDVFLDRGCDVSASAEALFVHANTIKYRLRKLEELCGINLKEPSDLLTARVATLTLKLL